MGGRKEAVAAIGQVARGHQYTLLQDGYHLNDANFDFAWSKEVVEELASQGVKHYALEISQTFQKYVDGYYDGEYSKKDIIEKFSIGFLVMSDKDAGMVGKDFANLLDYAKDAGVKVHLVDESGKFGSLASFVNGAKDLSYINTKDDLLLVLKSIQEQDSAEDVEQSIKALESLDVEDYVELTSDEFQTKLWEKLTLERAARDSVKANNIKEVSGEEKIAIMFGALHGIQAKDLDEYLGNDNVGKILLTPSQETLVQVQDMAGDKWKEMPATVIFTDAKDDWFGRHEIQPWQAEARAIGEEIQAKDFGNTQYSQLDMPPPAARDAQQEVSPQK